MINRDDLVVEFELAMADIEFLDDRLYDYNIAAHLKRGASSIFNFDCPINPLIEV